MSKNKQVKPFLKWVGGKTKLLSELEKNLPKKLINRKFNYVEPFLGGGAVFFHLVQKFNIEKGSFRVTRSLCSLLRFALYLASSFESISFFFKFDSISNMMFKTF